MNNIIEKGADSILKLTMDNRSLALENIRLRTDNANLKNSNVVLEGAVRQLQELVLKTLEDDGYIKG